MLKTLANARERLAASKGFTLIEALVTVTILGFLSAVSVTLIVVLINSQVQLTGVMEQQTTIERAYGFLSSRLATSGAEGESQLGIKKDNRLDPLSLAGDQFFFSSPKTGDICFRLMYLAGKKELRIASEKIIDDDINSCNSGPMDISPVRGPNEEVGGKAYALPSNLKFDPAIDSAYGAVEDFCSETEDQFQVYEANCKKAFPEATGSSNLGPSLSRSLASRVDNTGLSDEDVERIGRVDPELKAFLLSQGDIGSRKFSPFQFVDLAGEVLEDLPGEDSPSLEANSSQNPSFYSEEDYVTATRNIGGVKARVYLLPETVDSVAGRYYQQTFSVAQFCYVDPPGGGGAGGGGITGPITSDQLSNNSITYQKLARFPASTSYKADNHTPGETTDSQLVQFAQASDTYITPPDNASGRYYITAQFIGDAEDNISNPGLAILKESTDNSNSDGEELLGGLELMGPAEPSGETPEESSPPPEWLVNSKIVAIDSAALPFLSLSTVSYFSSSDKIRVMAAFTSEVESPESPEPPPSPSARVTLKMYWIGK